MSIIIFYITVANKIYIYIYTTVYMINNTLLDTWATIKRRLSLPALTFRFKRGRERWLSARASADPVFPPFPTPQFRVQANLHDRPLSIQQLDDETSFERCPYACTQHVHEARATEAKRTAMAFSRLDTFRKRAFREQINRREFPEASNYRIRRTFHADR